MGKKSLNGSWKRMTGVAMTIAIAAALFFCFLMIDNINKRMNESATANLLNMTHVIEGNLENYIEKDFESLKMVAELYKHGGDVDSDAFSGLCKTMGFEWVGVAAADGDSEGWKDSFNLADKPWREQWKPGETGYSDAYYGDYGRLQATLWVPVYEDGQLVGTVFGDVLLTRYYSANVFTFYEGAGRTYLYDGTDGSWILRSLGTDGLSNRQEDIYSLLEKSGNRPSLVEDFRQAVGAGETGTVIFEFNGETSYICFMPLSSSSDWYVATVIAKDVLLKESMQVRGMIRMLLLMFNIAIIAFAFMYIIWQNRQVKVKEVKYREALFANVFSNVDTVFLIYEKDSGKTAFVSSNVERMLGLERGRLQEDAGRLFDWCGLEQGNSLREAFLAGTMETAETREVCVDNVFGMKSRFIRLECIPAELNQEIAVITDITRDKEIQNSLIEAMEHAESASRAKNDFLSAMSHDIRTPMNGVIGMTAIAAANLDDKNRVKDCLGKINDASSHLLSIINEILDMSRIENGKMELSDEPFNLGQLMQEVLDMNLPAIRQKNHAIHVRIQSMDHEQVIGDPVRIQRIIGNLLSNAIKYTPDGGTISLELKELAPEIKGYGCYELIVKDNGIGMSREFQKKLFQPFEREEDVRKRNIQGTGLGMSIVKNIVSLMMGHIEVESEKGKGTAFRMTVNLKLDAYESISAQKLENLPVLVVDDDLVTCETVTAMLTDIGMAGEWVDNGAEAVEMVAERHRKMDDYLAVLLDWKMPDMDGVETARRIRAEVDARIPVIILTAYDWSEIEAEAMEAGVDTFLSKPLYRSKLVQKMMSLVERPMGMAALTETFSGGRIPGGKRILLAEDNLLNREIAVELLKMLGLDVHVAEDGSEAVEMFQDSQPGFYDLILMDIQMPRMNGYEAARQIRTMEREDAGRIPIVAMTADAFAEDVQAAHASGMDEHVSKPISVERLTQVMESFLAPAQKPEKEEETGEEKQAD